MRICHFSDWHARRTQLPKADLYVCTGDMLPNFPELVFQPDKWQRTQVRWRANVHEYFGEGPGHPGGTYMGGRVLDPEIEAKYQQRWIREYLKGYRQYFATPDAPVVCVRGNHDFTDLAEAFGGDVWEVNLDPTRTTEILGLKIGGCRGIPYIVGEWSDEYRDPGKPPEGSPVRPPVGDWDDIRSKLPTDLDILVTHAPPYGIMDVFGLDHWGSRALREYLNERMYVWGKLKMHCFGHIHEARSSRNEAGIIFSNAACSFQVFEI
jgi:Icc-related predicted phosphoesterase